jgi:hypothetical protein
LKQLGGAGVGLEGGLGHATSIGTSRSGCPVKRALRIDA